MQSVTVRQGGERSTADLESLARKLRVIEDAKRTALEVTLNDRDVHEHLNDDEFVNVDHNGTPPTQNGVPIC